jgi:bifunctional DNA-binding transcriptional regulator/antitoxin component of YhaV-PrlF toxin-antitoxin module
MNGETVKYHYYDSNKRSFITIPVSMARGMNWNHGDKIGIINHNLDGKNGFFIWKRDNDEENKE